MAFINKVLVVWLLLAAPAWAAPKLMVLGDSLSAGYGISKQDGWVALLQRRLKTQGLDYQVVNAAISGDTTAGGLARLPPALAQHQPALVLIELGANDGLRGLSLPQMQANLRQLIGLARAAGATPLLFEMRLPSNYGAAYTLAFQQSFTAVAKAEKVGLVPFFMAPIVADSQWFQDDGLHPTAAAQPQLLEAIWPTLAPLLRQAPRPLASSVPVLP